MRPALLLRQRRDVLEQARLRFQEQTKHRVRELNNRLASLQARLKLLGPEQVLARGYSITLDGETGRVLRSARAARPGSLLKTRLSDGEINSRVEGG